MLGHKSNDLKSISDFNSAWADRLAYLILVGLLVDIADLFIPEGWWKIVAAIGANLLIFGGMWGELWFAKRAREADDSRVAQANKQAAEAQRETEQIRAENLAMQAGLRPRRIPTGASKPSRTISRSSEICWHNGAYPVCAKRLRGPDPRRRPISCAFGSWLEANHFERRV
jgi:ABC-type protease/lipase transport system fused ATPase/permease subunit